MDGTGGGGVALVGHPNVGKSVLFQRLTGLYAIVANYPGTTVEVSRGRARFGSEVAVIDTPGIIGFPPRTEDERVVSRVLLRERVGSVVQVGDAKSLARTLLLFAQLAELRVPMTLALNMADEAAARGVVVDSRLLAERLGVPVAITTATRGTGVDDLVAAIGAASCSRLRFSYPEPIEAALHELDGCLPESPVAARGLGAPLAES